ncbi:MAG: TonB-dependent receptor [Porphyromonadaceae bacterium]|nr:TonB-dependent receptor [Porphyromonadaceae bacterium]
MLTSQNIFSQNNTESLSGRILSKDENTPIEIASVILDSRIATYSDKNGNFLFTGLKPGEYTYTITYLGYQTEEGKITIPYGKKLEIYLSPLSIGLDEIDVTAKQGAMGSSSRIGESAIQHIQPKSLDDMMQLVPGNLTTNPSINTLGQVYIREIDNSDANNALGTSVIVDGSPLSNDGNMQTVSTAYTGSSSALSESKMKDQTSAGRGIDTRIISPDNIEYMEVIRGIPSVEYGNLTSGAVIVKTKSGATPFEIKFKADPFSKMVYAGKGFRLKRGGAVNFGIDWSQSYDDTRKRYLGFERVTGTLGYSNLFDINGKPLSINIKGSFYTNVNTSRKDAQMDEFDNTFKNFNSGFRINIENTWYLNSLCISTLDLNGMVSWAHQKEEMHEYVYTSRNVSNNVKESGEYEATFIPAAYYSDYTIDGKPLNIYLQLKANRNIEFGRRDYTQIKVGADWRYDDNNGRGLIFDINLPPLSASSAQSLRPRSYRDIPAMSNLGIFIEDKTQGHMGTTIINAQAGVRLTNMFLDASAKHDNIFVTEPRINLSYQLLNRENNKLVRDFSLTGGAGVSYKLPTLLYLYPDNAYFDFASLAIKNSDQPQDQLAIITTHAITGLENSELKPAKSFKWEVGISFDIGKNTRKHFSGFITYFQERHTNEFGFASTPYYATYKTYNVPSEATNLQFQNGEVTYTDNTGTIQTATSTSSGRWVTYSTPDNRSKSEKKGIEYTIDFGQIRPLRTSLIIDGAWFNIKRTSPNSYFSTIDNTYPYIKEMPGGSGTLQDRINTNFRFITHIPKIQLIFSTTIQVVWYEREKSIWKNGAGDDLFYLDSSTGYLNVDPIGYYDSEWEYHRWISSYNDDVTLKRMVSTSLVTAYSNEIYKPWVMLNFRLTKEIGSWLDFSFMANNFTASSRYHTNYTSTGYTQLFSDLYFGAELRIKIDNIKFKKH